MSKNKSEIIDSGINQDDLKVAYSGSAILSNKFYVTVGGSGVRIAFAEAHSLEETPIFRTAVSLSIQDAIALNKLLQDLLREPQEK